MLTRRLAARRSASGAGPRPAAAAHGADVPPPSTASPWWTAADSPDPIPWRRTAAECTVFAGRPLRCRPPQKYLKNKTLVILLFEPSSSSHTSGRTDGQSGHAGHGSRLHLGCLLGTGGQRLHLQVTLAEIEYLQDKSTVIKHLSKCRKSTTKRSTFMQAAG